MLWLFLAVVFFLFFIYFPARGRRLAQSRILQQQVMQNYPYFRDGWKKALLEKGLTNLDESYARVRAALTYDMQIESNSAMQRGGLNEKIATEAHYTMALSSLDDAYNELKAQANNNNCYVKTVEKQ